MATADRITERCFRENNLIPLGKLPTVAQKAEALDYLNDMIQSLIGREIGELLGDWPIPWTNVSFANYPLYAVDNNPGNQVLQSPPQNTRLLVRLPAATTVYFPQAPSDGARIALVNIGQSFAVNALTINANGRLIEGAQTRIINTLTATPLVWFYRADLASWTLLTLPLAPTDQIPFPEAYTDFFVAALAVRLSPLYGKEPKPITAAIATTGLRHFYQQYAQTEVVANFPEAAFFNSYQSWGSPGWTPWAIGQPL